MKQHKMLLLAALSIILVVQFVYMVGALNLVPAAGTRGLLPTGSSWFPFAVSVSGLILGMWLLVYILAKTGSDGTGKL